MTGDSRVAPWTATCLSVATVAAQTRDSSCHGRPWASDSSHHARTWPRLQAPQPLPCAAVGPGSEPELGSNRLGRRAWLGLQQPELKGRRQWLPPPLIFSSEEKMKTAPQGCLASGFYWACPFFVLFFFFQEIQFFSKNGIFLNRFRKLSFFKIVLNKVLFS